MGAEPEFAVFFETAEPRLRASLVGAFGSVVGRDAAADALAWGWQNWSRLCQMANPVGYLYRVGRTAALKDARFRDRPGSEQTWESPWKMPEFEPRLAGLLADLSESQRVAVWLVHGLGYSQVEVADLLGCSPSSVATHVRRALARLRAELKVDTGV